MPLSSIPALLPIAFFTNSTHKTVCCAALFRPGEDAYAKIRAGASLVELYTALAYEGPALVPRIKAQLAECLARDGYKSVADAVGADHRPQRRRPRGTA